MGQNSKERKKKRKNKRLAWEVANLPKNKLPQAVAENPKLPDTLSFLDGSNYQLIFERYNHKECELSLLDPKASKSLINKLSAITKYNYRTIGQSNLIRDNIENANKNYSRLYDSLEDEIELKEISFSDTGRIFCYFVNEYPHEETACSYCCIIAIKKKHLKK